MVAGDLCCLLQRWVSGHVYVGVRWLERIRYLGEARIVGHLDMLVRAVGRFYSWISKLHFPLFGRLCELIQPKLWLTAVFCATRIGRESTGSKPLTHHSIEMQTMRHNTIKTKLHCIYMQGWHASITRRQS
jgi:hypothetical protein